jgi:hypothetical protein
MSLATRTILATLTLERLRSLCRDFNAKQLWPVSKETAVDVLEACPNVQVATLMDMLLFDELQKACAVLGLDAKAHRREVLVTRLMEADARPPERNASPAPASPPAPATDAKSTNR